MAQIDYPLLAQQKDTLFNLLLQHEGQIYTKIPKAQMVADLQGILNLLDDLTDSAVAEGLIPHPPGPRAEIRAWGRANHPES